VTGTLADEIAAGDRRALARGITLVESTRTDDRGAADQLLTELMPATGRAIRVGISGAPGSGKSTLIESLGLHIVTTGHRVAVLAVDPSSTRTGGSILGDKTRMGDLSRDPAAFVRPSPAGGTLGGVARRTREAMLLCEAAGFDVVLIETVGVGQSEVAVAGSLLGVAIFSCPASRRMRSSCAASVRWESLRIVTCSRTLRNSRMLPRQCCAASSASASGVSSGGASPLRRAMSSPSTSTSAGISARRSRNGGTRTGSTLRR